MVITMKNIFFFTGFIFFESIILSSCSTYIAPALSGGNNIGYLPRPIQSDSVKSSTYISGDFGYFRDESEDIDFKIGSLNISRGHIVNHFNFGYGFFGFVGQANYVKPGDSSYGIDSFVKSLYGGGLRITIGLQPLYSDQNFDFRILNWESAFSTENGAFYEYRKELYNGAPIPSGDYTFYVSKQSNLFTTGLSTEGIFNSKWNKKSFRIGYRLFIGYSPWLKQRTKNVSGTASYTKDSTVICFSSFFQYNRFFGNLETSQRYLSGSKFTLGYSF